MLRSVHVSTFSVIVCDYVRIVNSEHIESSIIEEGENTLLAAGSLPVYHLESSIQITFHYREEKFVLHYRVDWKLKLTRKDMDAQYLPAAERNDSKLRNPYENPDNFVYGLINTYHERVVLCPEEDMLPVESAPRHPCKCDKSHFELVTPRFDYSKFSTFLQAKCLMERQTRIRLIELEEHVLQVHDMTDDLLLKEMTDMYGELDQGSVHFKKLFQNYKLERIEQIETWCQEEDEYINSKTKVAEKEGADVCIDLNALFTTEELETFDRKTDADYTDWFVLPRRVPSIKEIASKKKCTSLNIFDPELHIMPFITPPICDINVGEVLAGEMYKIVKDHPNGISCRQFITEFAKKKSYKPNAESMNYGNFMEMIDDLSHHIIYVQKSSGNTMLYPMLLQGLICSHDETLFQIYHKIKFVLNLFYGIVEIGEAIKTCQQIFGWANIDFQAWGFHSEQEFVSHLIDRWKNDRLEVVSEDRIKPTGDPQILYLLELTEERRKLLKLHEERNSKAPDKIPILVNNCLGFFGACTSIHSKFMQPGQTIPDEMSKYNVGDALLMTVTYHISPTDFYMVQNNKFEEIDLLNKKLKKYCEREVTRNGPQILMINPKLILPGYCCIFIDENEDYYRAEYLKKEGSIYKCRLLDYGDTISTELKSLRYLDTKLGTKIPLQAFHCKLMDVVSSKTESNGDEFWDEQSKDYSFNLMVPDPDKPYTAKVFLKQFLVNHSNHQRQWVVWMCDRQRKIKDFGATIMGFISLNSTTT